MRSAPVGPQLSHYLQAAEAGHHYVAHNEVGHQCRGQLQARNPIGRGMHPVVRAQLAGHKLTNFRVVFDNQYLGFGSRSSLGLASFVQKRRRLVQRQGFGPGGQPFAFAGGFGRGFGGGRHTTGNLAFDDYRRGEIERLERERRRLDEERREFASFVEELKRAKDREEFDAFMAKRRGAGPVVDG